MNSEKCNFFNSLSMLRQSLLSILDCTAGRSFPERSDFDLLEGLLLRAKQQASDAHLNCVVDPYLLEMKKTLSRAKGLDEPCQVERELFFLYLTVELLLQDLSLYFFSNHI